MPEHNSPTRLKGEPAPANLKRRPGQPPKLYADEKTLRTIKGLGRIMATTRECAAVLNVHHDTFIEFCKRHPIVREILRDGQEQGRLSLRRYQFKLAQSNSAMAIFLGKNYLDQSDRQEHTGKGGGPIQFLDMSKLTDEQLASLEPVIAALAAAGGIAGTDPEGEGP